MVESNKRDEEGAGSDTSAEIWLAVIDGTRSVEEAIAVRSGHESTHELAVLAAICRPTVDAVGASSIPLRSAPAEPSTRRRGWTVTAWLAVAAAVLLIIPLSRSRLPEGLERGDAVVAADIERERRAVAGLSVTVSNGHLVHLGTSRTDEVIQFMVGDMIKIRGTTAATQPPRPGQDINMQFDGRVIPCHSVGGDRNEFHWQCDVPDEFHGAATLQACAVGVEHVETCRQFARIEVVSGGRP